MLWLVNGGFLFCCTLVFGSCFVVYYLVSFLDLQSFRWGRDSWLLYFNFLLMSFDGYCSVSLCHGTVGWSAVCGCGISWSYSITFM